MKTHHSFLEGASSPEELVEQAHAFGLPALAVTDRDGVYGLARAHVRGKALGVRVIPGAEITVGDAARATGRAILIATSREGYSALCRTISLGQARAPKGESRVMLEELGAMGPEVVVLSPEISLLERLAERVSRESLFALCARHFDEGEARAERALRAKAIELGVGAVGSVEVLYHDRAKRPLQDIVTCIRHGVTMHGAGRLLRGNAEHALLSPDAMRRRFADAPELLEASVAIAERCGFDLSAIRYRYPAERLPEGESERSWLRSLVFAGARKRYPDVIPSDVAVQLERELGVIEALDYGGYFLTMHEIVEWCRARDILCQGRGSAANSIVCYCLGITAIDPIRMDLLFERFLSLERAEPPDIDLDIEHERREEVIQHVYGRYDRRHAAMVANVIRYRPRSAVRDIGKALGLPATEVDGLARMLGHYAEGLDDATCKAAGLDVEKPAVRHLLRLAGELLETPRHLSIHPGGFLLGDVPVDSLVPIEPATMDDRTVIQWDKYDVEALGLFKVDLLGLGALTCVHRCFDLLRAHHGVDYEMATVPAEDPETYAMIGRGDTVGVFQIESRAQMAMLPRLRPKSFYDLVIEVAIVRPGPIQGDMVHPYLRRRGGEEDVEYPHPSLRRVLEKTLGVPIFQEQVMKLAVLAAGYTPGEADQLRRDMAAWRSAGRIEEHRERLVPRMIEHGIPPDFAERVFSQIRGFGEYGFPESHAASFALIAYVTAWLRRHYPAAFLCALLDAQPMGFYSPATLLEDAKRHGVEVLPIDVTKSAWSCELVGDGIRIFGFREERGTRAVKTENPYTVPAVQLGLRYVKGLARKDGDAIREARERLGGFDSLETFVRATQLSERTLVTLAEAGALAAFGADRRDALWAARAHARLAKAPLPLAPKASQLSFAELRDEERVAWDFRATGMSPNGHPMESLRDALRGFPTAKEVSAMKDGRAIEYVGMVICRQRPGTASGVTFFTLEDETGFVNLVVWKQVFEEFALLARTAALLGVSGRLQVAHDVVHLVAQRLWKPDLGELRAQTTSRDFR